MVNLNLPQETLDRLKFAINNQENSVRFLGFNLNLQTGDLQDDLQQKTVEPKVKDPTMYQQIAELLIKYALAGKHERVGRLVKFKDFSGGYAYEVAFQRRAVEPIAKLFGRNPLELIKAAEQLGGKQLSHGDCSVEIEGFPCVPLTIILWADEELPPTANVLFDESAGKYFNVEDLAGLSDLTTWRLSLAQSKLKGA
ncbi:MAG: DUF3786 domain-containing protein [Candidatus Bathyarchaeia archaeon]|jgi:hypothetical protein